MIPDRLEDWTQDVLAALCAAGQSESDRHDFKFGLPDPKNTTKLCCAFANTFGGYLVVGINDRRGEFQIEGIEPDAELYGNLLRKVRADPAIPINPPRVLKISASSKVVYIFEIPRSLRRPHLPSPADERFFWKRVGSSCEQMTLEEVRYQMNVYEEKREKLALLIIELHHISKSIGEQAQMPDDHYDGTLFSFSVIDRVVVEAYSLLKDDPLIFAKIDTLKKRLMTINAEKKKLLDIMVASYTPDFKNAIINQYRDFVKGSMTEITIISDQIARSITEDFGVSNPYASL